TQASITVNTVSTPTASRLVLAGIPSSVTAATAVSFTVTATDANGNRATGYRGIIHFSSSDTQAVLPGNYTFTAADHGAHTFRVPFKTGGPVPRTATDTATSSITGSQTGIKVNAAPAAAANRLVVAGIPSSLKVGTTITFTVTAANANGTTATSYRS